MLGPEINSHGLKLLPIGLFLHLFVAVWVYGCSDIYPDNVETSTETINGEEVQVYEGTEKSIKEKVI
jgi:hypothetical protein